MSDSAMPEIPSLLEQVGPPPLAEDLSDTDDFPEGEALPDQTPAPDDSIYEEE